MPVRAALAALLLAAAATPALAQEAITMDELTLDPQRHVGKLVTVTDCMLLSLNETIGGQCTSVPMSYLRLAYIDQATWSPETRAALYECPQDDITSLCVLEVTGTVALNATSRPIIVDAKVTRLRLDSAF